METVLLVGLRAGALDAAERLGLPVVAVVEVPPGLARSARLADAVVASFDAPAERWRRVAESVQRHRPAAVVALTERSVVPAAHLRAALGLDGLSVEAAHVCTDKRAMKRAARAAGLACADVVEAGDGIGGAALVERLGLPLVLKSAVGSGGRGTEIVSDRAAVPDVLPPGAMAESFVEGVEMSVETLAHGAGVWLNPTEYVVPGWSSLVPAPLAPTERAEVAAFAERARQSLGVGRGMTHLEVFRTASGPVFGEMAARPPGGHLMALIERAYGFDPWEAVIQIELGETPALPASADRVSAARILHPGPGVVTRAEGAEAARALGAEVALRVAPGDVVGEREGTGQEVGHVVVTAATADAARARLAEAVAAIRLEVGARGEEA